MSIPFSFYQGNRSEYYAIPALSKIGFTAPVPRQEDHFGVDFIVHLARYDSRSVVAIGKSFGIQIKSNEEKLTFSKQEQRDCLSNMSIPFFLGIISRENLTLTIYSTIQRLCFFWKEGTNKDFDIVIQDTGEGFAPPDYQNGIIFTGKPIMEISIGDSPKMHKELKTLQATMHDWIKLENDALSLMEQKVPIVWYPCKYETNKPFTMGGRLEHAAFFNPMTLPDICVATQKTLTSLNYYLKDCSKAERMPDDRLRELCKVQRQEVESVLSRNMEILEMFKKR